MVIVEKNGFALWSAGFYKTILKTTLSRLMAILLAMVLTQPTGVLADVSVPGQKNPAFSMAVQQWLNGADDLDALRKLSALASAGNTAAQILLARIGSQAHLIRDVTHSLPRNERIALLRQPGGLSGRSWLEAAAENSPLDQALRDSANLGARADAIGPLFEAGEVAVATRRCLSNMLSADFMLRL